MTIDHEAFAEANQPPPERATETPEVEASPEVEPLLDGVTNVDGVAVACRLEEGTMHVTVLLPGRIESISTSVHVPSPLRPRAAEARTATSPRPGHPPEFEGRSNV